MILSEKRIEVKMPPSKINNLMYGLMKEARRDSFMDFLEAWEITYKEWQEIEAWFKELDIEY
jgi:hypothetical protein